MTQTLETPMQAALYLAASALRDGFIFDALYEYTAPDGSIIYYRIRLKHPDGRKWIRPMRYAAGRYILGEPKFPPAGKPLYRQHELAARSGEMVYISEGENKADALAKLGILATTSGAADSATTADWTLLKGRTAVIWPDFDDAGQRYAQAVADKLLTLDCKVSVIDVAALALSAKGDAVNWLAAHPEAAANDIQQLPRKPINTQADAWPDPNPIDSELLPVEPFDPDVLLPDVLREWVMDSAQRMPCSPDFIAVAAMAALGSVIGAQCVIKPKQFDEWVVVSNLWGGIVGLPSAKKTPAMSAAFSPLDRLIAKAMEKFKENEDAYNTEKRLHDARESALEKQLKQAAENEAKQQNEDNHDQEK